MPKPRTLSAVLLVAALRGGRADPSGLVNPALDVTLPLLTGRGKAAPPVPPSPDRQLSGTMSGAPSRAASAVRSSGCRCDSRSASTRFS